MIAKDDRKNAEGYNDPTAYNAIKNVEQEQDKDDVRFHQLLNTLFRFVNWQISTSRVELYLKTIEQERFGGRCDENL